VANQTTMLASESIAIGAKIREAIVERFDEEHTSVHFRSFGTICSATQERQDAVEEMMEKPPDLMLVIGGYNSSNTNHLAHLCRQYTDTFHIQDASCIDVGAGTIKHKVGLDPEAEEILDEDWLPRDAFDVGITAGASTPNNKIGEALLRILEIRGITVELTAGLQST
jgi:4-hydroxy-3-methylbut-2-enyl diphosphate reductase